MDTYRGYIQHVLDQISIEGVVDTSPANSIAFLVKKKAPQIDIYKTGQNIKHIMGMRGMAVKDVQEYLGLAAVQSIYHWFAGRCLPTVDNLYALSELLDVPMDDLVCGDREIRDRFCYHPTYWRFIMYYERCRELLSNPHAVFPAQLYRKVRRAHLGYLIEQREAATL
ncbi:MAG: helix-turn-helix transcriptional regulator [Lachnospiraceae bacterium]|nr:helix-turn-helix transcriptional regulator [Lachnospiraceae bacterium]